MYVVLAPMDTLSIIFVCLKLSVNKTVPVHSPVLNMFTGTQEDRKPTSDAHH